MSSSQVRDCSSHGCSKAQACLKKILRIISSIQPPSSSESTRGLAIDLNQSLSESGELESLDHLSACSYVGKEIESDLSEEGRDGTKPIVNGEEMAEKTYEGSSSDITNLQETESKVMIDEEDDEDDGVQTGPLRGEEENNGVSRSNDCDCLALLIAAAELISSNESQFPSRNEQVIIDHDNEKKTVMIAESRNKWKVDSEDTSAPVVRSKRGRSQVLPSRYRDSVLLLEPGKRRPKRSSTSTSTVVPSKRQSR